VKVLMRKKIIAFCSFGDAKARKLLRTWLSETEEATWQSPSDIRNCNRTADFLAGNRVVFNVGGNDYRIVSVVDYLHQVVIIRWVGYHKDYDRIDATIV
jgi:mRNA interferase HigB